MQFLCRYQYRAWYQKLISNIDEISIRTRRQYSLRREICRFPSYILYRRQTPSWSSGPSTSSWALASYQCASIWCRRKSYHRRVFQLIELWTMSSNCTDPTWILIQVRLLARSLGLIREYRDLDEDPLPWDLNQNYNFTNKFDAIIINIVIDR